MRVDRREEKVLPGETASPLPPHPAAHTTVVLVSSCAELTSYALALAVKIFSDSFGG